ncbi:MAG TPA: ABC transporter substrate-binding protein [Chloroflexota bacterium]|nr:ABC transporter substrate-binding protein [Chloroflexota bacterium]
MRMLALLAAPVLLLAACGGASPPAAALDAADGAAPAPPDAPTTLTVWDGSGLIEAPLYIALERGYLKEQGLEVQPVPFNGAFDTQVPSLATGQLDVGGGSIVPGLYNAVGRGLPLRVTAIAALYTPGRSQLIVARKDLAESGQLKSYADLRGKVVARPTALGSATIGIEKALELGGLTSSDITYLDIPTADTLAALANKKADVAFMTEPFGTQAIEQGVAVKWHEMADLVPNHVSSIWAYGSRLIDDQPELGRRFMVALMRGMRDYEDAFGKNKDRAAIVSILTKYTPIKDPALYEKMQIIAEPASGEFPLDTLQEDYDWLKARGAIQEPAPALSQVVDTRFVQDALQQLGPYQ